MKRPVVLVVAAVTLAAAVIMGAYSLNRPTILSGDPWDYNLEQADFTDGWRINNSSIETAFDLKRDKQIDSRGLRSSHAIEFVNSTATQVFDVTSEVLLYDSVESAKAALAAEAPGDEWEKLAASRRVGDETLLWHLKPVETAPQQAVYRLDFRYLNGIASVAIMGLTDAVTDDSFVLGYATKVLERMQRASRPEGLKSLKGRPDLRQLLLTQEELTQLDSSFGNHWLYNSRQTPAWTYNSDFSDPKEMTRLGRLVGYQAWLIKPLDKKDLKPETTVGLFQQLTAFETPENARLTLEKMSGLKSGAWEAPPQIGETAKGWTQVYEAESTAAGPGAVALTEISFQVGAYVGSIRAQTSAVTEKDMSLAKEANGLLTYQLANALASKLKGSEK